MSLGLAGVLRDAIALWRSERALLLPLAGMFFVVPMLGIVLLLAASGFPGDVTPNKLREALIAFQAANIIPILLAGIALDFGTFAVLNLYLQGGGRTLGEVLMLTVRRFVPFLVMAFLTRLLLSVGLSLFVVPGLFIFARLWLAGPAFAAAPERGIVEAFRQGWRRSAGFGWVALLGAAGLVFAGGMLLMVLSGGLLGGLAAAIGGERVGTAFGHVVTALAGGFAWSVFALLAVAAYRRSEPKQGI